MTTLITDISNISDEHEKTMSAALPVYAKKRRPESLVAAYLLYCLILCRQTNGGLVWADIDKLVPKADMVSDLAKKVGWPTGQHGKPFPKGINIGGIVLHAGISHSKGLVCATISRSPIGIDLQVIPKMPPIRMLRIAKRFHPDEYSRLSTIDKSRLAGTFTRLWACKESALKLDGTGLSTPLSSFCVEPDGTCVINGRPAIIYVKNLHRAYLSFAQWL